MNERRFSRSASVYGEAVAALAATVALTLASSLVVTAVLLLWSPLASVRGVVELEPVRGLPHEAESRGRLLEELRRSGVAERVELEETSGRASRVILFGLVSREAASSVALAALSSAGFRPTPLRFQPELDPVRLVREPALVIPGLAIQATLFLGVGWLLMRWRVAAASGPGGRIAPAAGWGVLGGLAACGIGVGLGAVLEWIGLPVTEQQLLQDLFRDPANILRLSPWVVLAAPLAEEVFFRGYLFRFVGQGAGRLAGYLVSSGLFALVHLNPSGFLVYFAVGCVFAWVYRRSSRLISPILAHMTYNGVLLAAIASGLG